MSAGVLMCRVTSPIAVCDLLHGNSSVHVVYDPVEGGEVDGFDDAHVRNRHVQPVLGGVTEFAAGEAGAAEGGQSVPVGPFHGGQNVRAVTRAADGDQHVAWGGEVFQLFDKNSVEAFVVGPSQNVRRVVSQAENPHPFFVVVVQVVRQFETPFADVFAKMGGVRAAAAVADDEDEPAVLVGLVHEVGQGLQFRRVDPGHFLGHLGHILGGSQFRADHSCDSSPESWANSSRLMIPPAQGNGKAQPGVACFSPTRTAKMG